MLNILILISNALLEISAQLNKINDTLKKSNKENENHRPFRASGVHFSKNFNFFRKFSENEIGELI